MKAAAAQAARFQAAAPILRSPARSSAETPPVTAHALS